MSDENADPFFMQNYQKAVLFVTVENNPTDVRVYFAPTPPGQDGQGAMSIALKPQDPDKVDPKEQEDEQKAQDEGQVIYDPGSNTEAHYPYMIVSDKGNGDFKELDMLTKLAEEGKIAQVHAPNFEQAWPEVEEALQLRLRVHGWENTSLDLPVVSRTDHQLYKEDLKQFTPKQAGTSVSDITNDQSEVERLANKVAGTLEAEIKKGTEKTRFN